MEATEENQVANSYTEIESLKGKNKLRKSTHGKDRHNKKLKKNPISTDEFMVGASNDLHKADPGSLEKEEKEEKKEKKRRKGSQDKSKPSPKSLDTVQNKRDKKVDYCTQSVLCFWQALIHILLQHVYPFSLKKKKSDLEEIHAKYQ